MLGKLWRRLFGRRVFISYREREPRDNEIAILIAAGLERHGMYPTLEDQRQAPGVDYPEHIYRLLAKSEAVVSVWTPETQDSQWIFFESLTGRVQRKLHLVTLPGTQLHRTFAEDPSLDAAAILAPETRETAIANLVARIKATANGAVVYRSAPGLFDALRRAAAGIVALLVALLSLVVLFDNARKAVCSHDAFKSACAAAGWSAPN